MFLYHRGQYFSVFYQGPFMKMSSYKNQSKQTFSSVHPFAEPLNFSLGCTVMLMVTLCVCVCVYNIGFLCACEGGEIFAHAQKKRVETKTAFFLPF